VAQSFPDSRSVNEALRLLIRIAKSAPSRPHQHRSKAPVIYRRRKGDRRNKGGITDSAEARRLSRTDESPGFGPNSCFCAFGYRFGNLEAVRIISKAAITQFAGKHKDALEPLLHSHGIAKRACWRHLIDVRADFPHADPVGIFTVFNISGNKYRLISVIQYRWQIVYIRHILTHAEYDGGKWEL